MAEGKKTFIFYSDWINMINEMPDVDAGLLLKHILKYVNDENPQTDNLLVKMAFGHMKPMLKSDLIKWETQLKRFSDMGKKSAEKRALNNVEHKSTYVEPTSTVNVNDNVKVIKDINSRKQDFYKSLIPFLSQYDKELLKEFFEYWSEHGEKDRKFRKEKEKSFNTELRLKTWFKRSKEFKKEKSFAKKEKVLASDIIKQIKYGN